MASNRGFNHSRTGGQNAVIGLCPSLISRRRSINGDAPASKTGTERFDPSSLCLMGGNTERMAIREVLTEARFGLKNLEGQ